MVINLPFLGDRDYVNGATIFDAILRHTEPSFPFDLRFNSLIHGAVRVDVVGDLKPNGVVSFDRDGAKCALGLYDEPSSNVERLPYDEGPIFGSCHVMGRSVSSAMDGTVSQISRFIVMYKALVGNMLPDVKGKWLFTGATISAWPKGEMLRLEHVSSVGTRLIRSRAFVDDQDVGSILFSLA